jgi:hypothetical protein
MEATSSEVTSRRYQHPAPQYHPRDICRLWSSTRRSVRNLVQPYGDTDKLPALDELITFR